MAQWFEDEKFWKTFYSFLFPEQRIKIAAYEVELILKLTGLKGGNILDLCCGPGRHAVVLADKGFRVTGLDLSAFMLKKAAERAEKSGVKVEWIRADMREFCRPNTFDLIINMFVSFGYFKNENDDVQVLRNVHASLRPGGLLVMDLIGKEIALDALPAVTCSRHPDGTLWFTRHELVQECDWVRTEWVIVKGTRAKSAIFDVRLYSARELKDLLGRAGFVRVRVCGELDGSNYNRYSRRLVAVAERDS
jgi:SAM-dependent methyltransferase